MLPIGSAPGAGAAAAVERRPLVCNAKWCAGAAATKAGWVEQACSMSKSFGYWLKSTLNRRAVATQVSLYSAWIEALIDDADAARFDRAEVYVPSL